MHRGEVRILPASLPRVSCAKILAIQPEDHDPDRALIQSQYLLIGSTTITPFSLLDGTALTHPAHPAVSVAGVRDFVMGVAGPLEVVVFGTGAQERGQAAAVESVVGAREASISFVGRSEPRDLGYPWLKVGSAEAGEAVAATDLVICATTAREPILSLADVRPDALIIAIGSHTTDARELASDLMSEARVMVEDVDSALS